ncbi:hypothetical protein BDQ17DRAFT_1336065 [Cyathus striatus]|nr:hypothetical protein BDQ17DRAFT_1336065 [Cyathus striatus]
MKKPKKTSTQHIQEDIKEDAKGAPEKLTKAAKILEIGGDAVAPPPIIQASASTLPSWPMRVISSDIEDELNTEQAELIVQKNMESGSKAKIGTKAGSESKDETGSKAETGSNIEHGLDADLVNLNKQKDVETEIANKMQVDTQTGIGGSNMNAGELDEETDREEYEKRAESEKEKSAENVNENDTFDMKDNNKDGSEEMSSENEEEEDNNENENFENTTPKKVKKVIQAVLLVELLRVVADPHPINLLQQFHLIALLQLSLKLLGTKLGDILHNICVEYEYTTIQSCFIYIQDDDMWALKGKYHKALEKNETIPWIKDEKGKYLFLYQLIASELYNQESISEMVPALPVTLGGGTTSQHMKPSGSTVISYPFELDSVQYKIASAFNVSKGLCERNVKKDI